jgi:hypothetical protein
MSIGRCVLRRPWADPKIQAAMSMYWERSGITPTDDTYEAAGMAWWLGHLAAAVLREPNLAADQGWMRENVDAAAAAFI